MSDTTHAVIMAGGAGTRFWPASRRLRPKQLLPLAGDEALLRQAVSRVLPLCGSKRVWIATGAHLADATLAALPELGREQLLVEPAARNTAPCIAWAAHVVARTEPDAVVMALPSDHHIADLSGYRATLEAAVASARRGVITTIGIKPSHPETGYGYIEAAPTGEQVWRARRFVEKPDRARAEEFLAAGTFFWNAGMFFFRAKDMVAAVAEHLPELARGLCELDDAARRGGEAEALASIFPKLPSVSIDVGVMERMPELAMVPGDFGWNDLGSWLTVSELAAKDPASNSAPASAVLVKSSGNHVTDLRSGGGKRVIALCGVRDLVVVETDDALLIVHRDEAQAVREVVEALVGRGDRDLT
ncbi:MAG: mannose-1-phosphate guanylyltransferase [Deltaproteobacteria bacterium]|nr:mannose-1-phosphate guanylyltransferase [Deltaproteobacteria bacterium]